MFYAVEKITTNFFSYKTKDYGLYLFQVLYIHVI